MVILDSIKGWMGANCSAGWEVPAGSIRDFPCFREMEAHSLDTVITFLKLQKWRDGGRENVCLEHKGIKILGSKTFCFKAGESAGDLYNQKTRKDQTIGALKMPAARQLSLHPIA